MIRTAGEQGDERQASSRPAPHRRSGLRTLIVGAGQAGRMLVRDLRREPDLGLTPIGFVDDGPVPRRVLGLPVVDGTDSLTQTVRMMEAEAVIIAIPSLPPARIRALAEAAAAAAATVRYLPSFVAALERARASDLRNLRVDRLLGRDEHHVVRSGTRSVVEGKRVLVTGAGGSIGSELCRQIRSFDPASLLMLDHDESNLQRVQMELTGKSLLSSPDLIIADIRDRGRMLQIFRRWEPEVVFHAAAHKHLPLLELHPSEGVKSNVLGVLHVLEAASAVGTETFILISTDKAADPTSILGATKRVAEMIVQSYAAPGRNVASVRFGNVLGSRGSFLQILTEQIRNGDAITVTHPEVTRFFMTVEEAVGLVIEAAGMGREGETYVLDMGEPVRILDLVRNATRQLHFGEDEFEIVFTGLRPGEKLTEALFGENEEMVSTDHARIWRTALRELPERFEWHLRRLLAAAEGDGDGNSEVRAALSELFPDLSMRPEPTPAAALGSFYPDGF